MKIFADSWKIDKICLIAQISVDFLQLAIIQSTFVTQTENCVVWQGFQPQSYVN